MYAQKYFIQENVLPSKGGTMPANYIQMTSATMEALPDIKQAEVYDFATFLKIASKDDFQKKTKTGSVLNIIGLGKSGTSDISINHDKYLYVD
jgi:hypothetical protein